MAMNRGKLDDTLAAMFSNVEYRDTYLFYAHMIGQCSVKLREDIPAPAAVAFVIDHYNLYINQELFDKYTLKERLAILKHEMLHILGNHVSPDGRREDRVMLPWNFATDCAINQLVDNTHLPENCVTPKTLGELLGINVPPNKSSEFYYDLLKQEADKLPEKSKDDGEGADGQDGDGSPQLMDDHGTWSESVGDSELQQDITKKMIDKSQNETIKGKGKVPSECSEWLELHSRPNEVNWKRILRGIVGNKRVGRRSTIMRHDRRFPGREDLRGKTKDRMFNLLVICDVSGSMSDASINAVLGEVRYICDVTKTEVDMIQIDSRAYTPEKLSKKTKVITRKGYGGTMLSPALEMAKQHNIDYQAIVVLTDGGLWGEDEISFAATKKKVIWLIEPNGSILDWMNSGRMQACQLKES